MLTNIGSYCHLWDGIKEVFEAVRIMGHFSVEFEPAENKDF